MTQPVATVVLGSDGTDAAAALATATSEFVLLHDHRDVLVPDAAAQLVAAAAGPPAADVVYADGSLAGHDRRIAKPDWSPERYRFEDFIGTPVLLRTDLVRDVGGLHADFGAAAGYDLLLRVTERARGVVHLTSVLSSGADRPRVLAPDGLRRDEVGDSAARRAVGDQLRRLGIDAAVEFEHDAQVHRIVRRLDPGVSVSLIIPTRGQAGVVWGEERVFVVEAVRSALARTAHQNVEVVVVHDAVTPPEVLAELESVAGERLVLVEYGRPFNFSEKCNIGSLHAGGDVLVLLNDDTEAHSAGWLETLVAPLVEPDVGMTGAKLLFDDGTIQFGGHLYSEPPPRKRQWRHHYHRFDPSVGRTPRDLLVNRETSGITAACAALRRDVWETVGGLNEGLPVNYNDVDLSYKVRATGHRAVWLAGCEVYHFESRTREKPQGRPEEIAAVERRWGRPVRDPYFPWPDPQPVR